MSERERGMYSYPSLYILTRVILTLGGVEYDSPEAEHSEDASSAIGPVLDSTFPSTLDLPAATSTGTGVRRLEESMDETSSTIDSAVIGPVLETPEPLTPMLTAVNGSRKATGLREVVTADDIVAEGGDEDESEDGDDEEDEYDDNEDDDDEEEADEDEDEDDEDEDDEEPVLKYSKIEQAAADILEKDAASAIAVGATYFVSSLNPLSTERVSTMGLTINLDRQ
jgi:hypothetical protein